MRWRYFGRTTAGTRVRGVVEAPDRQAAMDQALSESYIVTRLEVDMRRENLIQALTRQRGRPRRVEIALFLRQLAGAVAAGVPVSRALELQAESAPGRMQDVIRDMHEAIMNGAGVAEAMARQDAFPAAAVRVIQAGEAAGDLAGAARRAAAQIESDMALRGKVMRAMLYPAFVMVLLLAAAGILTWFVLSKFAQMFEGFNADLPLPTRILIGLSHWVQRNGVSVLAGAMAAAAALVLFFRTVPGIAIRDAAVWRLPLIGRVTRAATAARVLRTLAALLRTGAPLGEALDLVVASAGNRWAERQMAGVAGRVLAGAPLADTLALAGVLPPLAVQALQAGEATGTLADAAAGAAGFFEEEAETALNVLTEALTPIVTVLVALAVLVIALAVYLPMSQIVTQIQ